MVRDDGTSLDAAEITVGSVTEPETEEELTALQVTLGTGAIANWFESDVFTGNLLNLYHNELQMDVYYTSEDGAGDPKDLSVIIIGRDGSPIRFV